MHYTYISFFVLITMSTIIISKNEYKVIIETKWQDLQQDENMIKKFGGKWILAGSITFRKKSKNCIYMDKIHLHWQGKPIEHLCASLYKKNFDKEFIPIEQNLLCDSCWNKKTQTLMLNFDKKEHLGPINIYYLVLTVPEDLEPILTDGSFKLEECCVPGPYKKCVSNQIISLDIRQYRSLLQSPN